MYDLRHYNHLRTNMAVLMENRAIWESLICIALGQLGQYNYMVVLVEKRQKLYCNDLPIIPWVSGTLKTFKKLTLKS